VGAYFVYDYAGEPFKQLGLAHIIALVLIAGLVLVLWRFSSLGNYQQQIRVTLAAIIGLNELLWHAWHIFYGIWTIQTRLPLEICNLMVIMSVWVLLTKNQIGYEFIYLLGIPAASQVLITPALGRFGFPHILFFQIFISHGGVVIAALYMTLAERMRPASWRAVWRVAIVTSLYAMVIFLINRFLGSNYLFLMHKPPADTLLDYLGAWPWYVLSMEVIGLVLVCLLYLPFHFLSRTANQEM
jgi:hypothetical integral membrane protein (TIGR02206 family)